MHFLSTYEHAIDAKNRLAIPADVRAQVDPAVHGEGWVAGPGPNGLLTLWPSRTFDEMLAPFSKDALIDPEIAQWRTLMYRQSARLEVDSAGRVRLPERLLKVFRLSGNVVILGAGDSLELIDAEVWKQKEHVDPDLATDVWRSAARARQSAARAANRHAN
ncbi:MAG: hypothetical protein U0575_12890 [Phycisphaerales bacterium]